MMSIVNQSDMIVKRLAIFFLCMRLEEFEEAREFRFGAMI